MKKILLLAAVISFTSAAFASEPLVLEPLHTVLSTQYTSGSSVDASSVDASASQVTQGVYEATYTPSQFGDNMVPQNAAAEGKPVVEKGLPRVNIETKQGRRTNKQWNPGGKGTKSFF